ncbi:putative ribonuclease H-like domain-containing protein [Tanacetum coccineum]
MDDEPMWAADRVVAPTPGSAIAIPETANEFAIKEMLLNFHGHNMSKGNIIKIFYHGLNEITQEVLNAAAGGIFLYKIPNQAYQLLEDKVLLKLDWAKNQKTKSSLKKTVAFADEGSLTNVFLGRPSGSLPSNTQPNPRGSNSKTYQPPQSLNEHVNVVFIRSGKSYDLPDNPNDQQNNFENPINFNSDDEDDEFTPQPKTQPTKPKQLNLEVGTERMIFNIDSAMKHSYSNDDTCFSIDVIDEILEEDFDALLDEGSKILHSIEGTLIEKEIFSEFDEFMAVTANENSESESDIEEPPFDKITINTNYKIKTSLEEPPTDLELKPLPDNLEYVFQEEPSFLPVIISSKLFAQNKNKLVSVLKKHKEAFAWKKTDILAKSLDSIFNKLQKIVSQLAILGENISQEDLNLKFLRSLPSEWNTHVVVWRNKPDLDTMSFDDSTTISRLLNKSTASTQVSTANLSDATVYAFLANQPNGSQLVHEDLEQIHEDDYRDGFEVAVSIAKHEDKKVFLENCYMADNEVPTNMAPMDFSDSEKKLTRRTLCSQGRDGSRTAQITTTAKLPIFKQENGNSFKPAAKTTTNDDGTSTTLIPGPVTTKEKVQKKNDMKARSMLLMVLPNEHLITFNQYKDAKTLFAAIQTRFGGNEATKKTQKTLLKQMNKPDLDTMSFNDLYNNFKIVEQEVKGIASSSSSSQNVAFVSSSSSTNEVNTAYETQVSTTNLCDDTVYAFLASQPNGSQLVHEDLEQIHKDDLEEIDLMWQLALLSIRTRRFFQKTRRKITINRSDTAGYDKSKVKCFNCHKLGHLAREYRGPRNQDSRNKNQDSSRRTVNVEETSSKAMLAIDGAGFNWSYMPDDEVPTNMALMAFLDFERSSNSLSLKAMDLRLVRMSVKKTAFNKVKESPDASLVEELVSDDKLEKKTAFLAKIEFVKAKQQEKPVRKPAHYNYYLRERVVSGNNYTRVNYNYCSKKAHPSAHINMIPRAVLMKTSLRPLNIARPITTAHPKTLVYSARPMSHLSKSAQSTVRRPYQTRTTLTNQNFSQKVNTAKGKFYTARPKAINTARLNSEVVNAVRENQVNALKALACWVWRPTKLNSASITLKKNNYVDARGKSKGGAKGGKITDKGTLKTGKLNFEDVYFVKELQFNLFSVSQMCDKKNSVLFTNTACFVLSPDIKLADESQVLLKVPRKNNMYSVDMKNIILKESLTCLVAKATLDESMLWYRRLGHVNFKTINKLVKENLMRGLPTKLFENDQTCVACLKGKQHKSSCKSKIQNSITQPLFILHMDLFGSTFMSNLMNKKYCLVVTDDYSRFNWVFFIETKGETSGILKRFITEIENLVDKKVKIIRCDNGTEFKNRVMSEFCEQKGIKREFSEARTPQQNGVAERRNITLIEATRTMLADFKLLEMDIRQKDEKQSQKQQNQARERKEHEEKKNQSLK